MQHHYKITNKIMVCIGLCGMLLLGANLWMVSIAFGPFSHYRLFYYSNFGQQLLLYELFTILFYLATITTGFIKFRPFLIIIILFSPYFIIGGVQTLAVDFTSKLNLFVAGHIVAAFSLLLCFLAFWAMFFWWKEMH